MHVQPIFRRLAQQIAPGSQLVRAWTLTGGASAQMTALELQHADGAVQRVVVRQPSALHANSTADEFRLLNILRGAGLPTPAPILLDSLPCLVMEFVEGQPTFAPANLASFVRQAAAALAAIHRVDPADLTFLPRHDVVPKLAERPEAGEIARLRAALREAWPRYNPNRVALTHGDFWPGNLLWREETLVAVVDWEDAALGDPLVDVAITRLDMRLIFGEDAMHGFTEHYRAASGSSFDTLPFWDVYAALRAAPNLADWAAVFPALGRSDLTERRLREAHEHFTAQALERG